MPSIVGIINKGLKEMNLANMERMHAAVMDDSGYSYGTYSNESVGIYLGWATHKSSFSDCMPVYNAQKDIVLFFIGEDFSTDMPIGGPQPNVSTDDRNDASYILCLYEKLGETFVQRLNGIFSGVIVDLRANRILLFIDRYGMQRVYINETKENILFSSRAHAIAAIQPECRQVDYKSLGEFFSCRCTLENRSLFSGVRLLPGGSIWTITYRKKLHVEKQFYFTPDEWENQEHLDVEQFYGAFREVFPDIVNRYFRQQDRMFLSLTGGLDTRMILAALELFPGQLPCYTHGGMFNESFDVKIARKVAGICKQPHQVLSVGMEFLSDFHYFAQKAVKITDGHLDVAESVGLYTSQIIKQNADIRLTGNYGSEILRNYVMFKHAMPHAGLFSPEFLEQVKAAKQTYISQRKVHPLTFIAFRQVPWYHYNRFALERSQIVQRSPFLDNHLVKLVYRAPQNTIRSTEIPLRFISEMNPELGRIRTDRGVGNHDGILSSLAIRAYSEFLFKMDYYFNHGMPDWLAKSYGVWAPLRLENVFLGRHKYNHFRVWFRDQLAEYIKEILLDPRTTSRPHINGAFVELMVLGHISGKYNYTQEISLLLTTELLHRCFIDQ